MEYGVCREIENINNTKKRNSGLLLTKSLRSYFDERVGESVHGHEEYFKSLYYAPSSEFRAARQEIICLDQKLQEARITWETNRDPILKRWSKTINRQRSLKEEELPQINDYWKDTFMKRARASKAKTNEEEQILDKEREIRRKKKEIDKLLEVRKTVRLRLAEFSIYKEYMEATKKASRGEFADITSIIDRYGILADAREELMNRNGLFRNNANRQQKALDDDVIMKSNEVLAYRNYLSELMEYDTTLQEQVFRLDDSLLRIKTTAAQRTLVIGQIKMAIRNLYLQVCKSLQRHPRIGPEDTLGQLLDVRISIREMSRLSRDIRRMLKAAHATARQEAETRMQNMLLAAERLKRMDRLMAKKGAVDVRELFGLPPLKQKSPDVSNIVQAFTKKSQ